MCYKYDIIPEAFGAKNGTVELKRDTLDPILADSVRLFASFLFTPKSAERSKVCALISL